MSWRWNTEPLSWKDKCSRCQQPLRVQGDGGIVIWTDKQECSEPRLGQRPR